MKQWKSFYPSLSSCSLAIVSLLLRPCTVFLMSFFTSFAQCYFLVLSPQTAPCLLFVVSICLTIINHSMCDNFCTVECYQQTTRRLMVCHYRSPAPPPFVTRFVSYALFMEFCYLAQHFSRSRNAVWFLLFLVFTHLCRLEFIARKQYPLEAICIYLEIYCIFVTHILFSKWFICI